MKNIDFYLLILAIIVLSLFDNQINKITKSVLPKVLINIRNVDESDSLYLLQLDEEIDFKNISINPKNEFVPKGKYGYFANALFIKDNVDLKIKKDSNSKIYFYNIGTEKAEIIHKKNKEILNLGEMTKNEIITYYPFKKSKLFLFYKILLYLLLSIPVYIFLKLIILDEKKLESKKGERKFDKPQ